MPSRCGSTVPSNSDAARVGNAIVEIMGNIKKEEEKRGDRAEEESDSRGIIFLRGEKCCKGDILIRT